MEILDTFGTWLRWIEQFPFVPRYQWSANTWHIFSERLTQAGIFHARDTYGNVLLGAQTPQEWFRKIQKRDVAFILQSHLDHPGAIVTSRVDSPPDGNRYTAIVQGGLHSHLKGKRFSFYDREGCFVEEILIDAQTEGFKEKLITFKTKSTVALHGYLRGPCKNSDRLSKEGFFEGWGMDNHVGCASLLTHFSQGRSENILGLLTFDEEIGGFGLSAHLSEAKNCGISIFDYPLLLSIEVTPEYPEQDFICGKGPRWRNADKNGALTDVLEPNSVALREGNCEAGQWVRSGGRAACLVIPSEFSHNALREKEWRAERVSMKDVERLLNTLDEGITHWKKEKIWPSLSNNDVFLDSTVRVYDHTQLLRTAALQANDYIACLHEVLPVWNDLHIRFGLPMVRFAQGDWDYWKKQILASEPWANQIRKEGQDWVQKVQQFFLIKRNRFPEIPIHLFIRAPFNASNQSYGIALSVEKLMEKELSRILIHEITHWLIQPSLYSLNLPPLVKTTLNEGIACKTSMDLLDISCSQALGFSDEEYIRYEQNTSLLASYFRQWLKGDLFSIKKGRHEVVEGKNIPHPFLISQGGEFPKYGYFIGLRFIQEQSTMGKESLETFLAKMKITEWITNDFAP